MRHAVKITLARIAVGVLCATVAAVAAAKLPPPTPEQAQAAAAKKAQAAAQAEKEKQELAASMAQIAARWRSRAAEQGWTVHAPTPVEPVAGFKASETQSGASGQPGGRIGPAAQQEQAPIRSEKLGTAPPSADVKTRP